MKLLYLLASPLKVSGSLSLIAKPLDISFSESTSLSDLGVGSSSESKSKSEEEGSESCSKGFPASSGTSGSRVATIGGVASLTVSFKDSLEIFCAKVFSNNVLFSASLGGLDNMNF